MEIKKTIGFIGGGRVVKIILSAFKRKGIHYSDVLVYDVNENALEDLKKHFSSIAVSKNNPSLISERDIIFLAVHPPVVLGVLQEINPLKSDSILISLVPKFKIVEISNNLDGFSRIIRMIPNAPSFICKGYNPVTFGIGIEKEEEEYLYSYIFNALGDSPKVKEDLLEAYAIVTGMGPTYFWPQINKLRELAVSFGIDEQQAKEALKKMLSGAASALLESNLSESEVMDLIPVYPMKEIQNQLLEEYQEKLSTLFKKLKA